MYFLNVLYIWFRENERIKWIFSLNKIVTYFRFLSIKI